MKELDGLLLVILIFNVVCVIVSLTMLIIAVLAKKLTSQKEALCLFQAGSRFIHQVLTLLHLTAD